MSRPRLRLAGVGVGVGVSVRFLGVGMVRVLARVVGGLVRGWRPGRMGPLGCRRAVGLREWAGGGAGRARRRRGDGGLGAGGGVEGGVGTT